jgi:hypothetical protein
MEDYDLRLDVPARAYINSQLLSLVEKGGTMFEAKRNLFARPPYNNGQLDPYDYETHDHSLLISLLFCTVVVPREFLDLPANHEIYRVFDSTKVIRAFEVQKPNPVDAYTFLRALRDSVAHALFSIKQVNGSLKYSFWTEREPILNASVTHDGLLLFLSTVGQHLSNAVLDYKRKERKGP